jgi:phosphatidylserine synthase
MKTTSQIFASLFTILALVSATGAMYGAVHQWEIAAISSLMAVALLADSLKDPEPDNEPADI